MTLDEKIQWNKQQSLKKGWSPSWFGATDYNEDLIDKIMEFQRSVGLKDDGLCGSATYRKIYTEREQESAIHKVDHTENKKHIVANGELYPINWNKVVLWSDDNGLSCKQGTYSSYKDIKLPRKPTLFVTHWDVCLSSSICARVLNQRGISVHFCIDNDGTIYQLVDMNDACWHVGIRELNHFSVGVEIANAYDLKWQDWYVKKGFGERDIVENAEVHGRTLDPFLDFYPVQIQALKQLMLAVHEIYDIPLQAPQTDSTIDEDVVNNRFDGFCNHFHAKKTKIDCANINMKKLINELKEYK